MLLNQTTVTRNVNILKKAVSLTSYKVQLIQELGLLQ